MAWHYCSQVWVKTMVEAKIGIIGGSGLYKMDALKNIQEVHIETPLVRHQMP